VNYLDAAFSVLRDAGEPLCCEEITQRALDQKLIATQGLTPAATMGSRLYTDVKKGGSRFVRAGPRRFGLAQWQPKSIEAQAKEVKRETKARLSQRLRGMQPEPFQRLIGQLLVAMGFDESSVAVARYHRDGGIDVIGTYRAGLTVVNTAVQVKHWKYNVRAPTVTQLRGSLQTHQHGCIITSGGFSKGARNEATAPGKSHIIELIDGDELADLLIEYEVGVTKKPVPVIALDEDFWDEYMGGQGKEHPQPPAPETPLSLVADKPRAKPNGFTLFGQFHATDTWRGVLLGVCADLAQRHGAEFALTVAEIKGKKRQYIAPSSEGMIGPAQIPGTELWVEANQSAVSVQKLVKRLLVALGDEPGKFAVMV